MVIIWVGKYYIEWFQVQVDYVFAVNELESSNYLFDEDLTFFFCETVVITCSSKKLLLLQITSISIPFVYLVTKSPPDKYSVTSTE